jgi:hypothetical protein
MINNEYCSYYFSQSRGPTPFLGGLKLLNDRGLLLHFQYMALRARIGEGYQACKFMFSY